MDGFLLTLSNPVPQEIANLPVSERLTALETHNQPIVEAVENALESYDVEVEYLVGVGCIKVTGEDAAIQSILDEGILSSVPAVNLIR